MATLPADRSKLVLAQGNQIPSAVASSTKNINAIAELYDTNDLLYGYVNQTLQGIYNSDNFKKLGIFNVKDFGAKGDWSANDTAAINAAIVACNASGGGIVYVPSGTYMIQGATGGTTYEGQGGGVKVLSNVTLVLSNGTTLKQIPTSHSNYNIVYFSKSMNAGIVGGEIKGDRSEHLGTTGEFGYGIGVFSSRNITIEGVTCRDCWGDGINIQMSYDLVSDGSITDRDKQNKNVILENVICDNNRRQGMSIESLLGGSVTNSRFTNTNGTAPQCGIDIEPPSSSVKVVEDVTISNCYFEENIQFGILVTSSNAKKIIINNNIFKNNKSTEGQIGTKNAYGITISNNILDCGAGSGIKLTLSDSCTVSDNRIIDGPILLYGCKDILCDDNEIVFVLKTAFNYLVTALDTGGSCENIKITNNIMKSKVTPATDHAILVSGKNIFINNNRIEKAIGAIFSSGVGTYFEFKNNFIIDMSTQGANVSDGSTAQIENNTFSGICYNNNGQSILRIRGSAVANINNNTFYKARIGGGDLGTGRPNIYLNIEALSLVKAYDNSIDTLTLNNLGVLSTVIPRINYRIGTTAQRPTTIVVGDSYYDTTLGKPIWYNGTVWKDAAGTAV